MTEYLFFFSEFSIKILRDRFKSFPFTETSLCFSFNKIELFGTLVSVSKHTCIRGKSSLSSHLKMMNVMLAEQEASVVH